MMSSQRSPLRLGWILVLTGAVLMGLHWFPIFLDWMTIEIFVGVGLFLAGVFQPGHGGVFPGTFLILSGLLIYLKRHHIIHDRWQELWPLFILFLGISFLLHFVFDSEKRGELWLGGCLLILSLILLTFPRIWDDLFFWIGRLWPAVFIVMGIIILMRSARR